MIATYRAFFSFALLWIIVSRTATPQEGMTARDVFWSSSDLITITPNPAHTHTQAHSASTHPRQHTSEPPGGSGSQYPMQSGGSPLTQRVSDSGYGTAPHFVAQAQGRLGLRCSIMLLDPDASWLEVPSNHVFHSGDRMRFGLLGNQSGFFYVIQQGSSGEWSPIYPRPSNQKDLNRIEPGNMQSTRTLEFDQTPGDERVFIIFSRTQIGDIEKAIEALKLRARGTPSQATANSSSIQAQSTIPDAFVQRLSSRDLKLVDEQSVNDSSSDEQKGERAVYVVAKAAEPSQEVVLEMTLHHE